MNEKQKHMARGALGLRDGKKKSYRNRFFVNTTGDLYPEWVDLQEKGMAVGRPAYKGMYYFFLTLKGAQAALEPGESLDEEDFPGVANGGI